MPTSWVATCSLARAREAAGGSSIAIAGGASTVRQYLRAGAIDELRLHISPMVLGDGARLFDGFTDVQLEPLSARGNHLVTHARYRVLK